MQTVLPCYLRFWYLRNFPRTNNAGQLYLNFDFRSKIESVANIKVKHWEQGHHLFYLLLKTYLRNRKKKKHLQFFQFENFSSLNVSGCEDDWISLWMNYYLRLQIQSVPVILTEPRTMVIFVSHFTTFDGSTSFWGSLVFTWNRLEPLHQISLSKSLKHIVNPFEYELDLMQRLFDKWLWNCVSGEDELQLNISYASMKHFSWSFIHFIFSSYWRNWNYIFDTQSFSN